MLGRLTRVLALGLLAAFLVVPEGSAAAEGPARCVSDNGTDVNEYFGLRRSDVIWLNLQGVNPPCVTVVRGHTFTRAHGWITQLPPGTPVEGGTIETVYPAGYHPAHPSPMRDFLSKISKARYVVSRDGAVEMTRTVGRRELLSHARLGTFGDLFVAPDSGSGVTIHGSAPEWTTLEPFSSRRLPVGEHLIEIFWTLTERHCDGFGADPTANCLPAGQSLATSTPFDVVAR